MCGNGIRCLAKYLFEQSFVNENRFIIETISGNKQIELIVENKTVIGVKVNMGEVIAEQEELEIVLEEISFKGYKIFTRKPTFCML